VYISPDEGLPDAVPYNFKSENLSIILLKIL
jgi:hypothetical protein